jgi:hypothetical protein
MACCLQLCIITDIWYSMDDWMATWHSCWPWTMMQCSLAMMDRCMGCGTPWDALVVVADNGWLTCSFYEQPTQVKARLELLLFDGCHRDASRAVCGTVVPHTARSYAQPRLAQDAWLSSCTAFPTARTQLHTLVNA